MSNSKRKAENAGEENADTSRTPTEESTGATNEAHKPVEKPSDAAYDAAARKGEEQREDAEQADDNVLEAFSSTGDFVSQIERDLQTYVRERPVSAPSRRLAPA